MHQLSVLLFCCTLLVTRSSPSDDYPATIKAYDESNNITIMSTSNKRSVQNKTISIFSLSKIQNNTNTVIKTNIPETLNDDKLSTKYIQSAFKSKQIQSDVGVPTRGGPTLKLYNKPQPGKRGIEKKLIINPDVNWQCPNISRNQNVECGCDMPHTLRCSGSLHGLELIADGLRRSPYSVSLLDCTLKNVSFLSDARIFENISLHGLVISSGEIKRVHRLAFTGMKSPLQALGLPDNALMSIPWNSLTMLNSLERLDLSNNKIKALGPSDFSTLLKLSYLELSDNQISAISQRTFMNLRKLITLKLNGNRLGDYEASLKSLGQCVNLRELDLKSNSIRGALNENTLPALSKLESLNLDRNILTSVRNGALQGYPALITLSMRHNQIDVLQDHAFTGLSSLQVLDLGYNGVVAISSASLQHLPRLLELDLTHNFLRALTSDLIAPLQSLKELRLDGNDISIVAKNALDGAKELRSLSLQDNPLSCDCSLRPFAEWLSQSKIPSQDLLGAVCATPPHLEGAPLLQIPTESFKCDQQNNDDADNDNILEQLEQISKQSSNNLSHIKDSSDVITLRDLKFSLEQELIMTWNVFLKQEEYACDAIFVYKEENIHEILLDNSPISCEHSENEGDHVVQVVLPDISELQFNQNYRFCLVLVQEFNIHTNLVVGCSNITRLESPVHQQFVNLNHTDISTLEKVSTHSDELTNNLNDMEKFNLHNKTYSDILLEKELASRRQKEQQNTIEIFNNFSANILPGLGFGLIMTSLFILIWMAFRFRSGQPLRPPVTTLYTSTSSCNSSGSGIGVGHPIDIESKNRYVKLATTSL